MKCKSDFIFKCLEKREGGEFTNDKGELVKFASCYTMKVDEVEGEKITERIFKFPTNNQDLYSQLSSLNAYDKISIIFDVVIYRNNARLTPIDIEIE